MKATNFKAFQNAIKTAKSGDDIWYMGFLWLQLTDRQIKIVVNELLKRDDCAEIVINGHKGVTVPNGMSLLILHDEN